MNRTFQLRRGLSVGVLSLLCIQVAEAARVVPAPSQALVHPRNRVALVEVLEHQEPDKLRCRVLERLVGESPDTLEVRLRPAAMDAARVGSRYLLGYTLFRKNPLLRDVIEEDPEGPKAVRLALAEDALLADLPEIRLLISAALDRDSVPQRKQRDAVMALLDSKETRARQLATYELFARDDLLQHLGTSELTRITAHAQSPERSASERDVVLKTFYKLPAELRGHAATACRAVLDQLDPEFDLSTVEPTLALTAAKLLGEIGKADDLALLMRFVPSNNPAVGRTAFESMLHLDAEAASQRKRDLLAGTSLHEEVRRYLENHF